MKKFTAAELIDNYRCNLCWHVAAIKHFSTIKGQHESQLKKLNSCVEEDTCDCRNLFPLGVPWPNEFSRTLKRLSIVRCPKILCIHIQRASVNRFGELVKLQGHISFPKILDLLPFTKPVVGIGKESLGENMEITQVNERQSPISRFDLFNHQFATHMLQKMYGSTGESISILSSPLVGDGVDETNNSIRDKFGQALKSESGGHESEGCCEVTESPLQYVPGKTGENLNMSSEPLVGDIVVNSHDFVDDKCAQASITESNVPHSDSCSYPEFTGSTLQNINGQTGENLNLLSEPLAGNVVSSSNGSVYDKCNQALKTETDMDCYHEFARSPPQSDSKINNNCHVVPTKSYMYRLVSVVEHFGRVGSGHYTVYRSLNSVEQLGRSHARWFCISDADVWRVSEKDVLASDASLLFYERIEEIS